MQTTCFVGMKENALFMVRVPASVSEDKRVHEITLLQIITLLQTILVCMFELLQNKQTNWYAETFKTGKTHVYQGKGTFRGLGNT